MSEPILVERKYEEESELLRYLWRNYGHLRTERECTLRAAALLEVKARHAINEGSAAGYREMEGYFLDPDVSAIADSGLDAFDQQCCRRIFHNYHNEIHINRCERCACIVASPIACTCLWCGHSWYERRSEMVARAASSIYPRP